ncbi:uncharacterized protein LOC120672605 [Panicum virgatum]|uniref:uncharacterized protein LOC120672605 n=1 Tax=Panicum virgatum TaxID=38727 RepID=UPI0019D6760A|nr:uncharacterized protein LOC120672605 [Panicum virgatum]
MRVRLAPQKRTIAVQRCAAAAGVLGGKKLRRLPHIFAKVLELPFAADADVSVEEDAAALRFVAAAVDGFSSPPAQPHAPWMPRSSPCSSPWPRPPPPPRARRCAADALHRNRRSAPSANTACVSRAA